MYMCCIKDNWFLKKIGEKNPHEDGSVAYKCYIFIKILRIWNRTRVRFPAIKFAIPPSPHNSRGGTCPNRKARSSERENRIAV